MGAGPLIKPPVGGWKTLSDEQLYESVEYFIDRSQYLTFEGLVTIFGVPANCVNLIEQYINEGRAGGEFLNRNNWNKILNTEHNKLPDERIIHLLTSDKIKETPLLFLAVNSNGDSVKLTYLINVALQLTKYDGRGRIEKMRDFSSINGQTKSRSILEVLVALDQTTNASKQIAILIQNHRICSSTINEVLPFINDQDEHHVLVKHYETLVAENRERAESRSIEEAESQIFAELAESIMIEGSAILAHIITAKRDSEIGRWLQSVLGQNFDQIVIDIAYDWLYNQVESNKLVVLKFNAKRLRDEVQFIGAISPIPCQHLGLGDASLWDKSATSIAYKWLRKQIESNIHGVQRNEMNIGWIVPFHLKYALIYLQKSSDLEELLLNVNNEIAQREVPTPQHFLADQNALRAWMEDTITIRTDIAQVHKTFVERTKLSTFSAFTNSLLYLHDFPVEKWAAVVENVAVRASLISGVTKLTSGITRLMKNVEDKLLENTLERIVMDEATVIAAKRGSVWGCWLQSVLGDDFELSVVDMAFEPLYKQGLDDTMEALSKHAHDLMETKWNSDVGVVVPLRIKAALNDLSAGNNVQQNTARSSSTDPLIDWIRESLSGTFKGENLEKQCKEVNRAFEKNTKIKTRTSLENNAIILHDIGILDHVIEILSEDIVSVLSRTCVCDALKTLLPCDGIPGEYVCDNEKIVIAKGKSKGRVHFGHVKGKNNLKVVVKLVKSNDSENAMKVVAGMITTPEEDLAQEWSILQCLSQGKSDSEASAPTLFNANYQMNPYPKYIVCTHHGEDLLTSLTMYKTSIDMRKIIIRQLVSAIHKVHAMKIVHGNLKPDHVLVVFNGYSDPTVKLCAFDCARKVDLPMGFNWRSTGWAAPELTLRRTTAVLPASYAMDLFALGLMIEILSREDSLFDALHTVDLFYEKEELGKNELTKLLEEYDFYQEKLNSHFLSRGEYRQVVEKSCQLDPTKRGTIEEIILLLRGGGEPGVLKVLKQLGKDLAAVSSQVHEVQHTVKQQTGIITKHVSWAVAQQSELLFTKLIEELPEQIKVHLDNIDIVSSEEDIKTCIESVKDDLKDWLDSTIKASSADGHAAVKKELRAQHSTLLNQIDDLSKKQDACANASAENLTKVKSEIVCMLKGMRGTLDTIAADVKAFDAKCQALDASLSSLYLLANENKESQLKMIDMLSNVQITTRTMIDGIEAQLTGNSAATIHTLMTKFKEAMDEQARTADSKAQETTQKINEAIAVAMKDLNEFTLATATAATAAQKANSDALLLATQTKLTALLNSFKSSEALMRRMNQLVTIIEARGNRLPTKFIILPELQVRLEKEKEKNDAAANTSSEGFVKEKGKQHMGSRFLNRIRQGTNKVMRKMYEPFWGNFRLFFICEASGRVARECGPEWDTTTTKKKKKNDSKRLAGYQIKIPTALTKTLMPLLLLGLGALKGVLQMYGVPPGLLDVLPKDLYEEGVETILDTLMAIAQQTEQDVEQEAKNTSTIEETTVKVQELQVYELFKLIRKAEGQADADVLPEGWMPKYTGLAPVTMYDPITTATMQPLKAEKSFEITASTIGLETDLNSGTATTTENLIEMAQKPAEEDVKESAGKIWVLEKFKDQFESKTKSEVLKEIAEHYPNEQPALITKYAMGMLDTASVDAHVGLEVTAVAAKAIGTDIDDEANI